MIVYLLVICNAKAWQQCTSYKQHLGLYLVKTSHQLIEGKLLYLELSYKLVHLSIEPLFNRLLGANENLLHGSVNPQVSRQTEPKVNSCIKCQQLALVSTKYSTLIHA